MKDKWKALFDELPEEDILRNLPEELPEMPDEMAMKRIAGRTMEVLAIDRRMEQARRRKRLLAAACCILAVGIFGHQPIMAAFQRVFHDLPGVGVYINDENKKIYEVQIDNPVREKDGVRVELIDFYCEGREIRGTVRITGENLLDMSVERTREEEDELLEEKFPTTWYYGEKSKKFFSSGGGRMTEDNKLIQYDQRGWEWLYLEEKGIDTYYLEVEGFERFTLKIVEPKTVKTAEELGYSQTLNGTTITARAAVKENQIEVEYYIIPTEEVKLAFQNQHRYFTVQSPYGFDFENRIYVENAKGERLEQVKGKSLKNGYQFRFEGGEEDFPLTFHRPNMTGTNSESYTLEITLPQDGETFTENLPKVEFQYGTVEILSIRKEIGTYEDGSDDGGEYPAAIADIYYRVTPKEGLRQMYKVNLEIKDDAGKIYGSEGLYAGDDYFTEGTRYHLTDTEQERVQLKFHMPSFWIMGDYDIVMEKPMD